MDTVRQCHVNASENDNLATWSLTWSWENIHWLQTKGEYAAKYE